MSSAIQSTMKKVLSEKEKLKALWEFDKLTTILIGPFFAMLAYLTRIAQEEKDYTTPADYVPIAVVSGISLLFLVLIISSIVTTSSRIKYKMKEHDAIELRKKAIESEETIKLQEQKLRHTREIMTMEIETKRIDNARKEIEHAIIRDKFAMNVYWRQKKQQLKMIVNESVQIHDEIFTIVKIIKEHFVSEDNAKIMETYVARLEQLIAKIQHLPNQVDQRYKDFLQDNDSMSKLEDMGNVIHSVTEELREILGYVDSDLASVPISDEPIPQPQQTTKEDIEAGETVSAVSVVDTEEEEEPPFRIVDD